MVALRTHARDLMDIATHTAALFPITLLLFLFAAPFLAAKTLIWKPIGRITDARRTMKMMTLPKVVGWEQA